MRERSPPSLYKVKQGLPVEVIGTSLLLAGSPLVSLLPRWSQPISCSIRLLLGHAKRSSECVQDRDKATKKRTIRRREDGVEAARQDGATYGNGKTQHAPEFILANWTRRRLIFSLPPQGANSAYGLAITPASPSRRYT